LSAAVPSVWFACTDLRSDARRRHGVAVIRATWGIVDALETLLSFEEVAELSLIGWLAIACAGPVSLDRVL
jgi:hypothetical protein